jgi:hypothetical protein
VEDEQSTVRIFTRDRERWTAEDRSNVTKDCADWDAVHVLHWQALQTLMALAGVTAGFLSHLGGPFEWEDVQVIATLGGWEPHNGRTPGTITLMRG